MGVSCSVPRLSHLSRYLWLSAVSYESYHIIQYDILSHLPLVCVSKRLHYVLYCTQYSTNMLRSASQSSHIRRLLCTRSISVMSYLPFIYSLLPFLPYLVFNSPPILLETLVGIFPFLNTVKKVKQYSIHYGDTHSLACGDPLFLFLAPHPKPSTPAMVSSDRSQSMDLVKRRCCLCISPSFLRKYLLPLYLLHGCVRRTMTMWRHSRGSIFIQF